MRYKIIGAIFICIIAIQFVPYGRGHVNPPVIAEPQWDSTKTRELFFRSCGDCHSNETTWPGYSNIAPISWLVQYDVNQGRKEFNVSMWGVQRENEGDESIETIEKGEMPPWFYIISHPEARLSEDDKKVFIKGLLATFGKGDEDDEHEDDSD
ncbi:MAG: heme-binding domain-containing protein [Nitrospiraceae bacterium]|nr:MAG: heme-binding domain-containing protein [Nitrospiraceae bacterium]